jgi:phosphatidylserine/phosphatidylglycerophosphate/cardiolipin synthase-like enzyme
MNRSIALLITMSLTLLACQMLGVSPTLTADRPVPAISPSAPGVTEVSGVSLTPITLHAGYGVGNRWFQLYFTDPADPASKQFTGGLDEPLVAAIDHARVSVHVAVYSLSLDNVRQALIRAHRRGLDVRMVMESDNLDAADPQALKNAGIPLLGDRRQGLMHNKFMVVDGTDVWTGSMNFTSSGAYSDNNDLIHLRSTEIAQDYEAEFNEMFVDDRFGPDPGSITPNPLVTVDGTPIDVYFSPDDHVQRALVQLLDAAKSSIYFLAYSFTADPLGEAMRHAAAAGVRVAGVMDEDQVRSNVGSEYDKFRAAGLDVRLDGNPGEMHHKLIIIDGNILVLGSYNFTASAETTNDENLIVIHDAQIAAQCMPEFVRVYDLAKP